MGTMFRVKESSYIECAILFMMFYTAPLFTHSPIRFSEVGAIMIIWLASKQTNCIPVKWPSLLFLYLGIWAIFDGIILSTYHYFIISNHVTQIIRLLLGIVMFVMLPSVLKSISPLEFATILRRVLIINLWIQIIYIIIFPILGNHFFNIISSGASRAALISENYKFFNHLIIINTQKGYPQFSGIFDEPAWFGWNLNLIIALILQFEVSYKIKILTKKIWTLIVIGYFFTFSMAAIGGLLLIWIVYYLKTHRGSFFKNIISISFVLLAAILFVLLNPSLLYRATMINQGGDGSTTARVIGSWNSLLTVLKNDLFTGFGLGDGNMSSYFSEIVRRGDSAGIIVQGLTILDIHNIIVQVICNLGVIGGVLYFTPILSLCKSKSIIIFVGFIVVYFSVNVFNAFFLFFMTQAALFYFTSIYYSANTHRFHPLQLTRL